MDFLAPLDVRVVRGVGAATSSQLGELVPRT